MIAYLKPTILYAMMTIVEHDYEYVSNPSENYAHSHTPVVT